MRVLLFGLIILVAAESSQAYTSKGSLTCGEFVDNYNQNDHSMRLATKTWFLGFITGYNYAKGTDLGNSLDTKSIELYVYNFCTKNPLKSTVAAADELIYDLRK